MSKVDTLLKVVDSLNTNPGATNTEIALLAGVSEQYLKMCKTDIKKLSPRFWKLLLEKNEINFVISKLNSNDGYEQKILTKLRKIYPEKKDGLIRVASPEDRPSSQYLGIGLCTPKEDRAHIDFWLQYLLYDVLFRINDNGEIDYRLASSCENIEGYSKWLVKLRDDIRWSDRRLVTYDDVSYSIHHNSLIAPMIQEIKKDDNGGVIFILFHDDVIFPWRISSIPIFPSYAPIYKVTNGPFLLRKGKSPINFHLYRNRDYYRTGCPKIDRVNLKTFKRSHFAIKAVEEKKLDILFPLSLHEVRQYSSAPAQSFFFDDLSYWVLLVNRESGYLRRKGRFHQLKESIDYSAIGRYLSGDLSQMVKTRLYSQREIGLKIGYLSDMPTHELVKIFKYITNCLETEISNLINVSNYSSEEVKGRVDVILTQVFFGYGYSILRRYFHSEGDLNILRFSYPDVDALIDRLDITASMDERKALGQEIIGKLIQNEAIILLAPYSEYIFSNLYIELSPKLSSVTNFIINLSDIAVERNKEN